MRCLMNAWPTRFTSGSPPARSDRLRHRPRRTHVVDHLAAALAAEDRLREQRRHEVARHELAAVVDEEAAVGVAVVGDAEVRALLARLPDDELAVLRQQRVRLVVRERPVRLEVAAHDVEHRQPLEHRRQHRARHAVRRVDHDPQRPQRIDVDERQHAVDEAATRCPRRGSRRARPIRQSAAIARSRTSSSPDSPPTGSAPARTIFIPVYSFGLCDAVTAIPPSSPSSPTAK